MIVFSSALDPDPDPDPDSMGSLDPYPDSKSGSGSRRAKMTYKRRKMCKIFIFRSAQCSLLRAEKEKKNLQLYFFLQFFSSNPGSGLDPDPVPYQDLDSLEMLDPDPYPHPDSMNPDPDPYRNLKSENSQDYAQKPQRHCMFMNSVSGQ